MSAAAEATAASPPAKGGKKKLLIIVGVLVLALAAAGGGAVFYMKKKAAEAAAAEEGDGAEAHAPAAAAHKADPAHPPTFVPLDPFVVNLADREVDKYAQIGITLQVDDPKFAEQLKGYMPAIRNGILMVLAHKTSQELLTREGKEALAAEVMRESVRPMGIELEDPEEEEPEDDTKAKKKKKKKAPAVHNPVEKVHFSSFIVQ